MIQPWAARLDGVGNGVKENFEIILRVGKRGGFIGENARKIFFEGEGQREN